LSDDSDYKGFYWNPVTGEIDHQCLEDVDAIIHLAGASISKRWTPSYKKEILESRTKSAEVLQHAIRYHKYKIKHVISASAIGIYPSSLTNYYEETNEDISSSFLGKVVSQWEAAVDGFEELGCKVSKIRIGLVLSRTGGALPEIVKPVKLGAGAAFGSGDQWQSWIHITDLAALFYFVLQEELVGIYNGVAPNAVTNKELTKAVASVLQKPLLLPNVPKTVMKLALGEMHILLFESQRVSAQKIERQGFHFKFSNLRPALEDLLL
jgi:uncharacterized protein (TIGR01777 family)